MKTIGNILSVFLGIIFSCTVVQGQELDFGLDFKTRFDNREYNSEYSQSKTLFGLKIAPEAGFTWGSNRLMAGFDAIRHFGAKKDDQTNPELILYYGFDNERNFKAYAGIFQRNKMVLYPAFILVGSKNFYDPNIEGAMFKYYGGCGFVEVACDWYSMITETQHERFVIYGAGNASIKNFNASRLSAGFYGSAHHLAGSETVNGVVDNILVYPYAQYQFDIDVRPEWRGMVSVLNSYIRAGWIQGFQNDRVNEDKFIYPNGFMAEAQLEWNRIGIHNTLYAGDNLMPFYERLGAATYLGDTFFRTENNFYNRLEVYWRPKLNDDVSLKISTVHHYDGKTWNWQQVATLSVALAKK